MSSYTFTCLVGFGVPLFFMFLYWWPIRNMTSAERKKLDKEIFERQRHIKMPGQI